MRSKNSKSSIFDKSEIDLKLCLVLHDHYREVSVPEIHIDNQNIEDINYKNLI